MCYFKQYSTILGIAGKGAHSYRILDAALVDYILTILLAFIIAYFTSIPFVLTTIVCFILGIISHWLFGVNTSTIKFLGLTCK